MSGYAINATRTQESYAITKRREVDNHYSRYDNIKFEDNRLAHRANWEKNTSKMIEKNAIANIARGIEAQGKASLKERQQRLAGLMQADEEKYRKELMGLRETSQQKATRMVSHARKLKADREAKRKAFAQEMYNRQWREACDDLRHISTENHQKYCKEEIAQQRREKARLRDYEANEEAMFAKQWEAERMSRVEQENAKRRERQRNNHETKMALYGQMESARQGKLKEAYETELDREAFRKQMSEDEAFAKKCQDESAADRRRRMDEIMKFNSATQAAKGEVARIQREEEIQDLNDKMDAHRVELDAKAAKREAMRKDMHAYMGYLNEQRQEQRRIQAELDRLTAEEQERENAKHDAQWAREQDTRDRLKEDVYRGRAQQLAELAEKHRQMEAELEVERQLVLAECSTAQEREFNEEEEYRNRELAHQQDILRQMQQTRNQAKLHESRQLDERDNAIEAERQYRAFVAREQARAQSEGIMIKSSGFEQLGQH